MPCVRVGSLVNLTVTTLAPIFIVTVLRTSYFGEHDRIVVALLIGLRRPDSLDTAVFRLSVNMHPDGVLRRFRWRGDANRHGNRYQKNVL
jgi:hypothetical protein